MAANVKTKERFNYTHYIILPMKTIAVWDWYPKPDKEYKLLINNIYLALVLFVLTNYLITLMVNLYTEWVNVLGSVAKLGDGLPLIVGFCVVVYFALYRKEMYELVDFMNENFRFHSARGLTNMTMEHSYKIAKKFGYLYTACTLFSTTMYVTVPMIFYLWTKQPLQHWIYMDITRAPSVLLTFLRLLHAQIYIGIIFGQLGAFYAANAILLCGQLDLLCCSLRNARYTALLQAGVRHEALALHHADIVDDEQYSYLYSKSELKDSAFHYDEKVISYFVDRRSAFDIYSPEFDAATTAALHDCARVCQVVATFKEKFEAFVSPLLVLRVAQVTLNLCTFLYASSVKFDMVTVEYLGAVALDMFVYCYFGNQIILQASRVSTAAYQSAWAASGARPRRALLNILLANQRPVRLRAGRFLPIDLNTFINIVKTSFSYYTLLDKMNH